MKKPLFVDINIKRLEDFVNNHQDKQKKLDCGTPLFSSVEFSINGACNRRCHFCPRVSENDYPNLYESLNFSVYENLINDLVKIDYIGRISFSGFCEPLLTKNLDEYISLSKSKLPKVQIEIVSNGDPLTSKTAKEKLIKLYKSGLDNIRISLYDGPEQRPYFINLKKDLDLNDNQFIIRDRFLKPDKSYGMTISNRAGSVSLKNEVFELKPLDEPLNQPCYYPFYKVLIDFDGSVLMCSNDWKKEKNMGNIKKESLIEIWKNNMFVDTRKKLINCDRGEKPCKSCDVEGILNGEKAFKNWEKFLSQGN